VKNAQEATVAGSPAGPARAMAASAAVSLHVSANGGPVSLVAACDPSRDTTVPIWAARRNVDLLAEALGREVEIHA